MASMSGVTRFRHRIQEIELSPSTSTREVAARLLVNGKELCKLRPIEAGQPLCWRNLIVIRDVLPDTEISIQFIEKRRLHQDRVGLIRYQIADVVDKDEISLECDNRLFTTKLKIFGNELAKKPYADALAKVQTTRGNTPQKPGRTQHAFKTLINFGEMIGKLDPSGSAKIIVAICAEAWEHLEQQKRQNIALNDLVGSLAAIVPSIRSAEELANANLGGTITDMLYLIEDASVFIIGYRSDGSLVQSVYSPFNSSIQERAETLITRFQTLKDEFDRGIALQMLEAQQLDRLKELNPVGHASYDPEKACMPGTRTGVIRAVFDWAQDENEARHVYWIHGFAGLGKSSIATSISQQFEDQSMLAASFFCKRDDPDLRDPRRVLNTIIYGLATRYQPYGLAVAKAIQDDAQLCASHVQRRYVGLVHKPLQSLGITGPSCTYVVVVDALDECEGRDNRAPLLACLRSMGQLVPWLKLVVTSRPGEDIMTTFGQHNQVVSRNLFEDKASQDIYAFVRQRMTDIAIAKHRDTWSEDTIRQLVERAGGLFIWAATACRFIAEGLSVEGRLQEILGTTNLATESHPLVTLDRLYEIAIRHSLSSDREDNRRMVRRCLGVIVCTSKRTPLPVSSLEALLSDEVEPGVFGSVVGALGSVLHEDGTVGGAVRVYHPSFEDYLVTRSDQFRVDLAELDLMVARCCLNTMLRELRFNICNLETSYVLNRDVPDLEDRIHSTIGSHLVYSCLYWSSHLEDGHAELGHLLREFLFGCTLLYWIEVLGLLNRLEVGLSNLLAVSSFPSEALADCSSCADDACRFILAFYDPISESTPHLYLSALPFAPAKSEIAQRLRPHFPNTVSATSGGDEQWSSCLRIIPISSPVSVLRVTFDGSRIVSGHNDGTIQVWDVNTGTAVLEPLQGHSGWVSALAVNHNNHLIASGSKDMTVMVWNIETGAKALALGGRWNTGDTINWISSIAFSPSGHRIASGSNQGKVMVWGAEAGALVFEASVNTGSICSVVFSHSCLYALSSSARLFTYIWSGEVDDLVLRPTRGPQHRLDMFAGMAVSQSRCLVANRVDNKIHVWDYATGAEACEPIATRPSSVYPKAFSPDGCYLLLFSAKEMIFQIWDTRTGTPVGNPLYCHSGVELVAFSPRNHRIISSSFDLIIRIWSSDPRSAYHKPRGSVSDFSSVEWSPNGDRVVSGHALFGDTIFRLWDAHTGALILSPPLEQYEYVCSVAFSPGGRHIASGLGNGQVIVCDTDSGAIVRTLEGPTNMILSVGFWVDGSIVYALSQSSLRVWDLRTGTVVRDVTIGRNDVYSTSLSPNGRLLAFSSGNQVDVKDIETNTPLSTLRGHSKAVSCIAFSSDSRSIASGSEDYSVRLWDVETGTAIIDPLHGHSEVVLSVSFSHDGRLVVSGSEDCTIRIWDAAAGALVYQPLQGHSDYVISVAFSFNSCRILSRHASFSASSIRTWDLNTLSQATKLSSPPTSTDAEPQGLYPFLCAGAVAASKLARHASPGGWVTTVNKEHLLWLPVEYRRVDDSSLCIMSEITRVGVVIDMRRFVHGTSWLSVAGPVVDVS